MSKIEEKQKFVIPHYLKNNPLKSMESVEAERDESVETWSVPFV
jgi:hypothetical protein